MAQLNMFDKSNHYKIQVNVATQFIYRFSTESCRERIYPFLQLMHIDDKHTTTRRPPV